MKLLTSFILSLLSITQIFTQADNRFLNRDNSFLLDTLGSVPGLTQYYDYVTNGNNLRKLVVLGDTIIVACDFTDSLNAMFSSARRTKYQVSFNRGTSWEPVAIPVLNTYSAYPDISPVVLAGLRTITVTGRGQVTGGAYAATDVILSAGSFYVSYLPNPGSYGAIVSAPINSISIACAYSKNDSLFFRTYNINSNTFSPSPVFVALLSTNSRYYLAASFGGTNVFVMWWDATLSQMKGRESTNGGVTFGSVYNILSNSVNVEGDLVTSWFPADVTYKPGTNTPVVAISTLGVGAILTAEGSKVIFWSPGINGGLPVRIADRHNMPGTFIADPNFNQNVRSIQAGMTPLSHPSIAFSSDGTVMTCVFSVTRSDTTYYGYHYNSIYGSYSLNNGLSWVNPHPAGCIVPDVTLTCPECDEIYPTLSETGNLPDRFHMTYSLSKSPGSVSFYDPITPISKVYQIYKKYCPLTLSQVILNSSEIPERFSLLQNYPNPFNPNTVIKFDVMKRSFVKIIVYDISGREVERLVEQNLNAGKYSVDFDGGNLASGIYFYSLTAGDFAETKKMILVK